MKLNKTERGFSVLEFFDRYGEHCSLQKSSLATEDAIWFGRDNAFARMHLTQEMVAELLPYLQKFVDTGEL